MFTASANAAQLPPEYAGNFNLYILSLVIVMTIACVGIGVSGWMVRDAWRDRALVSWNNNLSKFRAMMALIGGATFCRSIPDLVYLQSYGDRGISYFQQMEMIVGKNNLTVTALFLVLVWVGLLVAVYPPVCSNCGSLLAPTRISLKSLTEKLGRLSACFVCIVSISVLFGYAKIYGL